MEVRSRVVARLCTWPSAVTASSSAMATASVAAALEPTDAGTSARSTGGSGRVPSTESTTILSRSEEHTSELQSLAYLVCRLLLEKKNNQSPTRDHRITPGRRAL